MGCRGVLVTLLMAVALAGAAMKVSHHRMPPRNWTEAQKWCREDFSDLVSMDAPQLSKDFLGLSFFKQSSEYDTFSIRKASWIGLSRKAGSREWVWSETGTKLSHDMQEFESLRNDQSKNLCVAVSELGEFHTRDCAERLPFFCHRIWRNSIKIDRVMTWNKALSYCRKYYDDMASLLIEKELLAARYRMQRYIGGRVYAWIGLRYVCPYWLWMNGDALEHQAWEGGKQPQRPDKGHYCGAINTMTGLWVNMDCEEELPFLCRDRY